MPVVFTRTEAKAVLGRLIGVYHLLGSLLYGTGMRSIECLRLRVKDIDFEYKQITVRKGKGAVEIAAPCYWARKYPNANCSWILVRRERYQNDDDLYLCVESQWTGSLQFVE
ncbi:tyrosine-type recombinase/integrase [Phormidesmis sp. 146-35]